MAAPAPPAYGESDEGDFEIHMDKIGRELQCRICITAYDDAMVTRCDHYFCATCITSSIQHKKQCPLCKAPVTRRELRVDERMRALVNTYRSVLASHRMKNVYCSQLPASARARAWRETASPENGRRPVSARGAAAMPPPPPRCADEPSPSGEGRGKKRRSDVAAETSHKKDHKMDHEKEREKERDGDAKKKSGSARRTSTRARVPGTGDEARRRKRRDAG